jgi:hypothetical protein
VFKERGNFACAAYPGDRRHRADIWNTVGISNGGRPDPIIPRKIEQKATFIGRHVMDMKKLAKEVRERDYALKQARWEREKEEERIARQGEIDRQNEEARLIHEALLRDRQERLKLLEEYNTNSKCDKTRFGTFGTPILSSTNMLPPLNKDYTNDTTVGMGGGYATPICEKASQTSQARKGCRQRDGLEVASHEFDSTDLGVVFDTRRSDWREQYYAVWREKYAMA